MTTVTTDTTRRRHEKEEREEDRWYKYGVAILYLEMAIAVGVSLYAMYMAFTGQGGIPGH